METKTPTPVVCILNPDDVYSLQKGQDSSSFITLYDVKNLREQGLTFPDNVREGSLLMLTNENKYVQFSKDAEDEIISSRIIAIQEIVSYLGATNFSAETECLSRYVKDKDKVVRVAANYGENSGDAKYNNKEKLEQTFSRKESISAMWTGVSDEEGYQHANDLARQHGLIDTAFIAHLIAQRNPNNRNKTSKIKYSVDLNSDIVNNRSKVLEIRTRIKDVLPQDVGASIDYDKNCDETESQKLTLDCEVIFGDEQLSVESKEPNIQQPLLINENLSYSNIAQSNSDYEKLAKISGEIERRATSEEVDAKLESVSSRFSEYTPSSEIAETVSKINADIERRATSEEVDAKLESVSSRFSEYTPSSEIAETVNKINADIERRATSEEVDAKLDSVSSRFADYTPSSELAETIDKINADVERRAISDEVNAKLDSVSSRFSDYATSSSVAEAIARLDAELDKRAQIETNLQKTIEQYKKIGLILTIGIGVISLLGLLVALFLQNFIW